MTDVNISVEMLKDAFQNRFDLAILISADSDLVRTIETIIHLFPKKKIVVAFPPDRVSKDLKRVAHGFTHISRAALAKSLFPKVIQLPNGFVLIKPATWR